MSHNGIDIDQYILLIIYPSIAFFLIGFITKKKKECQEINNIHNPINNLLLILHCVLPFCTPRGSPRSFTDTGAVWGFAFGASEKGKGQPGRRRWGRGGRGKRAEEQRMSQ